MRRNVFVGTAFGVALLPLMSCVTGPNTASGRPEIRVLGATADDVKNRLVGHLAAHGWIVERSDAHTLVMAAETSSTTAQILLSSSYDSRVLNRATFSITSTPGAASVYASVMFVTNPGSAFERITDVTTGNAGSEMQSLLESLFPEGQVARPAGQEAKALGEPAGPTR